MGRARGACVVARRSCRRDGSRWLRVDWCAPPSGRNLYGSVAQVVPPLPAAPTAGVWPASPVDGAVVSVRPVAPRQLATSTATTRTRRGSGSATADGAARPPRRCTPGSLAGAGRTSRYRPDTRRTAIVHRRTAPPSADAPRSCTATQLAASWRLSAMYAVHTVPSAAELRTNWAVPGQVVRGCIPSARRGFLGLARQQPSVALQLRLLAQCLVGGCLPPGLSVLCVGRREAL